MLPYDSWPDVSVCVPNYRYFMLLIFIFITLIFNYRTGLVTTLNTINDQLISPQISTLPIIHNNISINTSFIMPETMPGRVTPTPRAIRIDPSILQRATQLADFSRRACVTPQPRNTSQYPDTLVLFYTTWYNNV